MTNLNKKTSRPIFIFIFGIILLLSNSSETLSQDLNMNREPDTGFKPGLSYSVSDFESINTTNGNINFTMPLGNLPAGRGTASAGITLQYDSQILKTHIETTGDISGNTVPQQFLGPNDEAGWRYGNKYRLEVVSRGSNIQGGYQCTSRPNSVYTNGKPDYRRTYNWKVKVHFPDGSQHEFRPSGYSDRFPTQWGILPDGYYNVHPSGVIENVVYEVIQSPISGKILVGCQITTSYHPDDYMTYYSSDGSYLKMIYERTGRWTIYFRDGSRLVEETDGTQYIYDRNNNSVHSANIALPNGATGYGWKDEFGRYTAVQYGFAANEDRIYNYGFNGQVLTTRIIWKKVTILRRYRTSDTNGNGWHSTYSLQYLYLKPRVIDKIILPIDGNVPTESTGLTYTFEYDAHDGEIPLDQNNPNYSVGWGRVKSVTMPTTAKVEYEYDAPFDNNNTPNIVPEYIMAIPIKKKTLSYTETHDGNSEEKSDVWLYNIKHNNSSITSPSGAITTQKYGSTQWESDLSGLVTKQTNPDGSFVENIWKRNIPDGSVQNSDTTRFNQYIKTKFTTITNNAGNPSLTKITDYEYDKNGNVTETKEYDWVAYSAMPKDSDGSITGIPSGIAPIRRTQTNFFLRNTIG